MSIVPAVAAPASAATIAVAPTSVATSGTVTLSGDLLAKRTPGCAVPGTVTLVSDAFAGLSEFAGQGAVNLPVDATGHFSSAVTIKSSVAAGSYGRRTLRWWQPRRLREPDRHRSAENGRLVRPAFDRRGAGAQWRARRARCRPCSRRPPT